MPTFSQDEMRASENSVECRACGQSFNLGAVPYFGPECPDCR